MSTRTEKRYLDTVQPGAFEGLQPEILQAPEAKVQYLVHREEGQIQLGEVEAASADELKMNFNRLRTRAERLAYRVDYLTERLEIVDQDPQGMFIQLRSFPPLKDDNGIQFNEINLRKGSVSMRRIAFTRRDEMKQEIPILLSEGALDRLLLDLRQVLAS